MAALLLHQVTAPQTTTRVTIRIAATLRVARLTHAVCQYAGDAHQVGRAVGAVAKRATKMRSATIRARNRDRALHGHDQDLGHALDRVLEAERTQGRERRRIHAPDPGPGLDRPPLHAAAILPEDQAPDRLPLAERVQLAPTTANDCR